MIEISVINKGKQELPSYATTNDVGMDIRANIDEPIVLGSLERVLVPTGLYCAVPNGYELTIQPRSGLAAKNGITVLNTPGECDPGYRGEIKVILINLSKESFTIEPNSRIAQCVVRKVEHVKWNEVDNLDETDRVGGFGSTGVK